LFEVGTLANQRLTFSLWQLRLKQIDIVRVLSFV